MANPSQTAGNNGASGYNAPGVVAVVTPGTDLGTTFQDNGNLEVSGSNAVRRSVSKTDGSPWNTNDSKVFSITSGFRTAYENVECDLPALDAVRATFTP
jgi:hypothetical protein